MRNVGGTFYIKLVSGSSVDPITIATEVLSVLPNKITAFYCLHAFQGVRSVRGFIYENKLHGEFFIEGLSGEWHEVFLSKGVMKVIK